MKKIYNIMLVLAVGLLLGALVLRFWTDHEWAETAFHAVVVALVVVCGVLMILLKRGYAVCVTLLFLITGCASRNDIHTEVFYPDGRPMLKHSDKSKTYGGGSWGGGGNFFHFRVGGAPGYYGPSPVYVAPPVYTGSPIGWGYHY